MKLPKIPIDYSKAESGEAPFDGGACLLHAKHLVLGYGAWDENKERFIDLYSGKPFQNRSNTRPAYYTPMPEFEEVTDDLVKKESN